MQVHLHVVHGSPEIFGVAESICSARAGFSTGIILGAHWLCGSWYFLAGLHLREGSTGVACCLDFQCVLVEGLVALFEVNREGLVVVLCGAGPIGPCLCGGC